MSAERPGRLQIYDARERRLVAAADLLLAPVGWFSGDNSSRPVRRILLLRLERIGDLLMTIHAIRDVKAIWPEAVVDLAVGVWNEPLARMIPGISRVLVATAPWLARDEHHDSWKTLVTRARDWRRRDYDLVLNFEPDIRSNLLAWIAGAHVRVGYSTGGGGALLTRAISYDPSAHVSANARRLVAQAAAAVHASANVDATSGPNVPSLTIPEHAEVRAASLLATATRPLVGIHVSGGRLSKQWHLDRFSDVARYVAERHGATVVLTGSASDRAMVNEVKRLIGSANTVDVAGALALPELAALLTRLDLFVTSDTGPMHLAGVMGVPTVALFGPSEPTRYGPLGSVSRVIRVDLPCSPCGQVRLPPGRCRGHVPDCMDSIRVDMVTAAVDELLIRSSPDTE